MAQTIKLKRSATSGAVPTTSSLALGEVAINTHDGKMYIKKDDGTASVVEIGATGSGGTADTAAQILTKIKTVDGAGSGLDADTCDGQHLGPNHLVQFGGVTYYGFSSSSIQQRVTGSGDSAASLKWEKAGTDLLMSLDMSGNLVTEGDILPEGNIGIGVTSPTIPLQQFMNGSGGDHLEMENGYGGGIRVKSYYGNSFIGSPNSIGNGIKVTSTFISAGKAAQTGFTNSNAIDLGGTSDLWKNLYVGTDAYINSGYGSAAKAYQCRAWGRFEMSGTHSFRNSGGFSSVTDIATGRSRLNFTSAMPDSNYCVNMTSGDAGYTSNVCSVAIYGPATTYFYCTNENVDAGFTDNLHMNVSVIR